MIEEISKLKGQAITQDRVDQILTKVEEPSWLKSERRTAWELYLKTPWPTGNTEGWRRVDLDELDLSKLQTVEFSSNTLSETKLPDSFCNGLDYFASIVGVFALTDEGIYSTQLCESLTKQGVIFCDLLTATKRYPDLLREYFDSDFPDHDAERLDSKFGLMNKSLFNGGMFLYIPENVEVDGPFLSINSFNHNQPQVALPRVLVVVEKNSRAQLVNVLTSTPNRPGQASTDKRHAFSLLNASLELHVKESAKLEYVEIQNFDQDIFAVTEAYNLVDRDGQLSALTIALGGGQIKAETKTVLGDRGATSNMHGLVLGAMQEHFSFNTIQEHNAPDTKSNINFRVALKDESLSVFQGIIKVAKIAQRTDAYQSNKNLLLGNQARADSIPKLEILADDVKCSHGATVGPVDPDQVFYLMSRGLSLAESEELIVTGFFRQVLEQCTISGVSEWVNNLVAEKIAGGKS